MPKAVVMFMYLHESRVDTVDLPEGHDWNQEYPSSNWGHFQICNKCGIAISWSRNDHKWEMYEDKRENAKRVVNIPSCDEVVMNKALE